MCPVKQCRKCHEVKPAEQFDKNKGMPDGRINHCKDCVRLRAKAYRVAHAEKVRTADNARANTPQRLAWRKEAFQRYQERHPGKHAARVAVRNAVRDGRMQKWPCQVCGEKAEAHHADYSRPLDVVWLCFMHHREAHQLVSEGARHVPA